MDVVFFWPPSRWLARRSPRALGRSGSLAGSRESIDGRPGKTEWLTEGQGEGHGVIRLPQAGTARPAAPTNARLGLWAVRLQDGVICTEYGVCREY